MARIQVAVTKKQTHRLNALVLVGVLLAFASVVHAERTNMPQERNFGMALPGEKCRVSRLPKWTEPEKWAWIEICEGRIANFNKHLNEKLDPRNPAHDGKWSDERKLSSRFLETILLHEPFRSAIPRQGVRIIGAYFSNAIDLTDASIERPLLLHKSRFRSQVYMTRLKTPTFISLEDSKFDDDLNMDSASVGGDLFMRRAEFGEVILRGVEIDDQLDMEGATFKGKLNMDASSVGVNLFMRKAAFREVNLRGAKVGDQLELVGSTFRGKLSMASISVGSSLFMTNAEFGEVVLRGAEIDTQLSMDGSTFRGKLSMDSASVGISLFMRKALFGAVDLKGADIRDYLDMDGSTFKGKLDMDSASVGVNLFIRRAELGEVNLRAAKIGDQLEMDGSTFKDKLGMDSASVGVNLFMRNMEFDRVDLRGAKIGGQLNMNGSTFKGKLIMDSASIGSSLLMRQAEFGAVDLVAAKIGGQLSMVRSTFKDKLIMQASSIGSSLFLWQVKFNSPADLMFLSIGSGLDVRGATLRGLDLTGSRVEGELRLGSSNADIEWKGQKDKNGNYQAPKLTLRNVSVGALQDTKDTWPDHLEREFEGFTYDRLGGFGASEQEKPDERGSSWFIEWLAKDESYSPQPYRHLAGVLRTTGHEDMADDILFASRDLELEKTDLWPPKWLWLGMLRFFIGYGLRYYYALYWIAGLTAFGTVLLCYAKENDRDGTKLGFWYSLDMLLPIIHLREWHYTDVTLNTRVKYYFYVHKIMGYVLISFILAGLSGLVE